VATDSGGLAWTSAVSTVVLVNYGVTIASPADGTTYLNTNPITVSALALLPSGTVTNVEFRVDDIVFGRDASSPFSARWTNVTPGVHRFTALAGTTLAARTPPPRSWWAWPRFWWPRIRSGNTSI